MTRARRTPSGGGGEPGRHGDEPRRGGEPRRRGLERILSKQGVCSRTQARAWIEAGRVSVNKAVILDPDAWFDPERDEIRVDGRIVRERAKLYYAMHKPRGYITTRADPGGRPTVYALLPGATADGAGHDPGESRDPGGSDAWVVPVGRLDLDTSGLLLFTNDTQFADLITSPRSHVPKSYVVECAPRLDDAALESLRAGVLLHDGPTRPATVEKLGDRGTRTRFSITITEGRNRQVRRMVKAVGAKVEKLQRVSIGPLHLGDLASGAVRPLTAREVEALVAAARSAERGTSG